MNATKRPFLSLLGSFICFAVLLLTACSPPSPPKEKEEVSSCISPPTGLPTYLDTTVYPNCFPNNVDRLGKWTGVTKPLSDSTNPNSYFASVAANSIGSTSKPTHLYVLVHGWAQGLRTVVQQANGNIKWWSADATDDGVWESAWAWSASYTDKTDFGHGYPAMEISGDGFLQQIITHGFSQSGVETVALAYSWVDNSATVTLELTEDATWASASQSEAYTNLNGIRLASAIEAVLDSSFVQDTHNVLHILGHSHGAKVATVATLELQKLGIQVDHLSIFDSPEAAVTQRTNSANLLGYYFNQMNIANPADSVPPQGSTFVDSYISMFGAGYAGGTTLNNMAQVSLNAYELFNETDLTNKHAYSATWYSNTASSPNNTIGMGWPPVPNNSTNTWYQNLPSGDTPNQWEISEGALSNNGPGMPLKGLMTDDFVTYTLKDSSITLTEGAGTTPDYVTGSPSTTLTFAATANGKTQKSVFEGTFNGDQDALYGLSFDIKWEGMQQGDYVVVTVTQPPLTAEGANPQIAMVLDGSVAAMENWHPVSINTDSDTDQTALAIHYYPVDMAHHPGKIMVQGFNALKVTSE